MKVMAGLVEADQGLRVVPPAVALDTWNRTQRWRGLQPLAIMRQARLNQENFTVWNAQVRVKFDPDRAVSTASGGERRRAALAKLMAEAPELMLLDEPTNHLDIQAISWLENELKSPARPMSLFRTTVRF